MIACIALIAGPAPLAGAAAGALCADIASRGVRPRYALPAALGSRSDDAAAGCLDRLSGPAPGTGKPLQTQYSGQTMASIGLRRPRPRHPSQTPSDAPARRRPLAARCALLSFLWPGLGQIAGGARRRGIFLAVLTATLLVGALVVLGAAGPRHADRRGGRHARARRRADRERPDRPLPPRRHRRRRPSRVLRRTAPSSRSRSCATLVILPQAAAGWYAYTAYDTVTEVFEESEPTDVLVPVADEFDVPVEPTTPPAGWPEADPTSVAGLTRTPEDAAAALAAAEKEKAKNRLAWKQRGRLNVLLLGADAGPGRGGMRTDTMIVATIGPSRAARPCSRCPATCRRCRCRGGRDVFAQPLNGLYEWATAHPERFVGGKDPGPTAMKQTIGQLVGLPIDYYVMVDFRGFYGLVDALGGVDVNVPEPVLDRVSPYEEGGDWVRIDLKPGRQHLDRRPGLRLRAGALAELGLLAHRAPAVRHRVAGREGHARQGAGLVQRPRSDVQGERQHRHPREEPAAGGRAGRRRSTSTASPRSASCRRSSRPAAPRRAPRCPTSRPSARPSATRSRRRPRRTTRAPSAAVPASDARRVSEREAAAAGRHGDRQAAAGRPGRGHRRRPGRRRRRQHESTTAAPTRRSTPTARRTTRGGRPSWAGPLAPGTFGENLTIDGLESAGLAVGDRLVAAGVTLEVTSPRIPCATLAARMDDAGFIRRFRDARRPGVYLRVLRPGQVGPGDAVTLQRAADGALTVLGLQDLYYDKRISADAIERALRQPIDIRSRRDFERRLATK